MSRSSFVARTSLTALFALSVWTMPLAETANATSDTATTPAQSTTESVSFRFVPSSGASVSSVSVRGSFNGWGESPMSRQPDGSWSLTLDLEPGEYQYKYFINGDWPSNMAAGPDNAAIDLDAHGYVSDGYGGKNAVRNVGEGVAQAKHRDPAELEIRMDTMQECIDEVSIEIYPVILRNEGNLRIAQLVALFLERANVKDIRVNDTPFNVSAVSDVWTNSSVFGDFIDNVSIDSDYAMLGEFWQRPDGGFEVRGIVVDAEGCPVWVDSHIMGGDFDPMHGAIVLVERLRTRLGLPDPQREDAPEGEWAEFSRIDSGVPADEEFAAMEDRQANMREKFANANVIVFPILQSDEFNPEGAVELAALLETEGICPAKLAPTEVRIEFTPTPSQLRRLWDMARGFRDHVRTAGIDADYGLLAEYLLNAEAREVLAVNFVLCDAEGEWVVVDLQNSHHEDFTSIAPETLACCNRLVAKRMTNYLAAK